jgi:hypothetical protein
LIFWRPRAPSLYFAPGRMLEKLKVKDFIGLSMTMMSSVFSKNRERLLEGEIAAVFCEGAGTGLAVSVGIALHRRNADRGVRRPGKVQEEGSTFPLKPRLSPCLVRENLFDAADVVQRNAVPVTREPASDAAPGVTGRIGACEPRYVVVRVLPVGNPSSLAAPARLAVAGSVIVWLAPALTVGAWLAGFTVIVTSDVLDNALSEAVRRTTYEPATERLAVVLSAFAFPKVTVAGPLTFDHVVVRVLPVGNPSSLAVPARLAAAGSLIV